MNAALLLLMRLRFWGWWRRLRRNVASVRGALFVAFGVLIIGCWIVSLAVSLVGAYMAGVPSANVEKVRRFAPLFLFGYCLLTVLTTAGDRALTFRPAEVNFLFAGPFSRRQILGYKILTAASVTFFSTLLFTALAVPYAPMLLAAFLTLLLAFLFLQLFGIAVALVGESLGEYASSARRKVAFALLGVLAVAVLVPLGRDFFGLQPTELLERVEASPVLQWLLTPFRWFGDAFTAERLWPDLVGSLALCVLMDSALLGAIFLLDAHYLEAASAASERVYRRLERMRAGPAAVLSGGGRARFTLPELPQWGGVGPIAWRQALTAVRNLKGLLFIVLTFACFVLMPFVIQREGEAPITTLPLLLTAMILGMPIFLMQLLNFDFRTDLDRMEVLKSLPISPVRLVLGQLLTPVALACVLQAGSVIVLELSLGGLGRFLGGILLFLPPFNVLLFGVMNLLFLWFPTRMTPATAGDFQMMGRQLMLYAAIWVIVLVLLGVPLLLGTLAAFLTDGNWFVGGAVAWIVLMMVVSSLIPVIALAFRNFDVARDTPP